MFLGVCVIDWMLRVQRVTSLLLWAMNGLLVLFALLMGVAAIFMKDARILLSIFSVFMFGLALASTLFMPLLAWAMRGGARPWLDAAADELGGSATYPGLIFPLVRPHLDGEIDGRPFRVVLMRTGGVLGPRRPGARFLLFQWTAFVWVEGGGAPACGVFPAGARPLLSPTLAMLTAVPSGDADFDAKWTFGAANVEQGRALIARPAVREAAAAIGGFPGLGVGGLGGGRARWQGRLVGTEPADLVALVRGLAALAKAGAP